MTRVISIHAARGGTGKSNTLASLAVLMTMMGKRVAVVDMDIQSPGLHLIFGQEESGIRHFLNDYLWEKCKIEEAAHDLTMSLGKNVSGKLFLVPASLKPHEITRVLRESYDPSLLNEGFHNLSERLALDVLLIDTHPGINEEAMLATTISDIELVVLRPNQQDYISTNMLVDMARRLNVKNDLMLLNQVPKNLDIAQLKKKVEDAYLHPVAAIVPYTEEMMLLAGIGVFALRHPDHTICTLYKQVAETLLA